ncbi:MAG: hypothetical protein ABIQ44_09910, partial [Chloroflexia bacterium]
MAELDEQLVFLFDVDNTLLDNDRSKADMGEQLRLLLGDAGMTRFWEIYEQVRKDLDVVSWPVTVERFQDEWPDKAVAYKVANIINGWHYEDYLYSGTTAALSHVTGFG